MLRGDESKPSGVSILPLAAASALGKLGAGTQNRTGSLCLEGKDVSRYTTPAKFWYRREDLNLQPTRSKRVASANWATPVQAFVNDSWDKCTEDSLPYCPNTYRLRDLPLRLF